MRPLRTGESECQAEPIANGGQTESDDYFQVYCRMRPLTGSTQQCVRLLNTRELILHPPEVQSVPRKTMKYDFTHVFTEHADQKDVFSEVAIPLLSRFVGGQDGLLLTYGITGSGKTYTMQGTHKDAGIVPRSVMALFNTLGHKLVPKCTYEPSKYGIFQLKSSEAAMLERKSLEQKSTHKKSSSELSNYENDGTNIPFQEDTDSMYAIYVYYVEIYNNVIYDLLDEDPHTKKLPPRILREICSQQIIQNVKEVEVRSAEDVFELLALGAKHRKVAETKLNAVSSRSHSIFTIRLLKTQSWNLNNPLVTQLMLVDLAGSERGNRTNNTGKRLREAGSINSCLMQLRHCLRLLKENQDRKLEQYIPYRDRKLTMLFKKYFDQAGKVSMIVCLNPSADDYEENLQVLEFAEMVQEIDAPAPPMLPPLFSTSPESVKSIPSISESGKSEFSEEGEEELESSISEDELTFDKVIAEIRHHINEQRPRKYYEFLKAKEIKHREDVANLEIYGVEMRGLLSDTDMVAGDYLQKLKIAEDKLARHQTENHIIRKELDNTAKLVVDFQNKNAEQAEQIDDMHSKINQLTFKKRLRQMQILNQKEEIEALASQKLMEKDRDLRRQRDYLRAAFEEKIKDLEECNTKNDERFQVPSDTVLRARDMNTVTPSRSAPVVNMRSCNSNNAGGTWIEHLPKHITPSNTVFKSTISKRKSLTNLKDIKNLSSYKRARYLLMSQNQDNKGNLQTNLFKGDILPTCSGGVQIVFGDVETVSQDDPRK